MYQRIELNFKRALCALKITQNHGDWKGKDSEAGKEIKIYKPGKFEYEIVALSQLYSINTLLKVTDV